MAQRAAAAVAAPWDGPSRCFCPANSTPRPAGAVAPAACMQFGAPSPLRSLQIGTPVTQLTWQSQIPASSLSQLLLLPPPSAVPWPTEQRRERLPLPPGRGWWCSPACVPPSDSAPSTEELAACWCPPRRPGWRRGAGWRQRGGEVPGSGAVHAAIYDHAQCEATAQSWGRLERGGGWTPVAAVPHTVIWAESP